MKYRPTCNFAIRKDLFQAIFFNSHQLERGRACLAHVCSLFSRSVIVSNSPYLILNMVQVKFPNVIFEKIVKILKLKVSCYKNIVKSAAEF